MSTRPLIVGLILLSFSFLAAATECEQCPDSAVFIHFEDLERGTNVTGMGGAHPDLNIESLNGSRALVIETGFGVRNSCGQSSSIACEPYSYGAPRPLIPGTPSIPNNCLEDEHGEVVKLITHPPLPGVKTAKGFSDVDRFAEDVAQEFRFTFGGATGMVSSFEIVIVDFGDLNRNVLGQSEPFHSYGLYAFADPAAGRDDTHWVASDVVTYETDAVVNPVASRNPNYGDLRMTGDACAVDNETNRFPGHRRLRVQHDAGIAVVYLRERNGADPHAAFDSIRFVPTCDAGQEGCSPGYWKNHPEDWPATGFAPTDSYAAVFGVQPSFAATTLIGVLEQGGGGEIALGRQAVAAILNAAHPNVAYGLSVAGVIAQVQHAYASGDIRAVKERLERENLRGCESL